jgi:rhodanese-related sulfurtransferase
MAAAWAGFLIAVALLTTGAALFNHYVVRIRRAHRWLSRGAVLVDVDSPSLFARRHPRGAVSLPLDALQGQANEALKDAPAVVVFAHSWRSGARAVHELRRSGFANVTNAAGLHTLRSLELAQRE